MSQAAPTFCIQVPTLETMEASHSRRNSGLVRGVQGLRFELSLNFLLLQQTVLTDKDLVKTLIALAALSACAFGQAVITATATPTSVSFAFQLGAATLPAVQNIAIKPSSGTPAFTTTFDVTALWLIVTPASGAAPASIGVRVNPTTLGVGVYTATIMVTIAGVTNPLSIPVTLTVTSPPATLTLSATAITMVAPPIPPPAQSVLLSTTAGPISFTATAGAKWLTVSPTAGVVLPGEQLVMTISADPTILIPQTAPYTGKITIAASGVAVASKSQTITVNLTVSSLTPTITNVWPASLPTNAGPQTITVYGTSFYSATIATVQGLTAPLATTVVDSMTLLAVIPATLTTVPTTLNISVSNPPPGGAAASSIPLPIANMPIIQAVVNGASYVSGSLSPGELATIFGIDVGPVLPASLTVTNSGYIATTAGNVSVTIDGVAAPIFYASSSQVTVQVPYEVSIGNNIQLVLTNGNYAPVSTTVNTALTAPGIFTAASSGSGQAAALNYISSTGLYTLNSGTNLVKIGDYIILYMTGEGSYAPALTATTNTGYIIPSSLSPLPQLNPLPTVTIGGVNATVNYAGPLVGSVIGLLQINAIVPTGATTGAAVPVVVTIGGNASQAGVTIGVHP